MTAIQRATGFRKRVVWVATAVLLGTTACSREGRDDIVINEIYSTGPGNDWIELFNRSGTAKDIGGYSVFDDPMKKYVIPRGTVLRPGAFLVLYCAAEGDSFTTGFGLSSAGETLILEDTFGTVDKVTFPALVDGTSFGRLPDGSADFVVLSKATEGEANTESPRQPPTSP